MKSQSIICKAKRRSLNNFSNYKYFRLVRLSKKSKDKRYFNLSLYRKLSLDGESYRNIYDGFKLSNWSQRTCSRYQL